VGQCPTWWPPCRI